MTKEIGDIVRAFGEAQRQGRKTALATVVHVEGSSYRRPGARMLVEDNGQLTGAISGGCLEGDALRKALLAINQGQNKLVTYDTLNDDDVSFGVQLGCNGIVHILFEPVIPEMANNPIALLEMSLRHRKNAVLVTLFSLENFHGPQPGTCFFFDGACTQAEFRDKSLEHQIKEDAAAVLAAQSSLLKQYHPFTAFVELLQPPVSLIIAGAGNDAVPLVEMAAIMGWQITVADGRRTHATKQRFPRANQVIVGKPAEVVKQVEVDERTFFVIMTHNYNYDLELLGLLLQRKCRYIGTLGPKKRLERLLGELEEKGLRITDSQRAVIYGPIGLDIGAEAAEEIALSVLAEMKAVLAGRRGSFLRERQEGIHARPEAVRDVTKMDVP